MESFNKVMLIALKKQVSEFTVHAIHKDEAPVSAYSQLVSLLRGEPHCVVTVPAGSSMHALGFRFLSVPVSKTEYYIANGSVVSS